MVFTFSKDCKNKEYATKIHMVSKAQNIILVLYRKSVPTLDPVLKVKFYYVLNNYSKITKFRESMSHKTTFTGNTIIGLRL